MKILVVDDERDFDINKLVDTFHYVADTHEKYMIMPSVYLDDFVLYARTYEYAEWKMGDGWDIVYLDHDLGEKDDVIELAKEIEEFAYSGKLLNIGKFVVHSMNPVGRMNIYNALSKFYNVEFARVEDLM